MGGAGIGAEIMGRNTFAPKPGPWPEEEWQGWWGDNPPFHTPVVVLTHHPRPPLEMQGGTTFHFVDAEPADALEQARALAGDLDIRTERSGPPDLLAAQPRRLGVGPSAERRAGLRSTRVIHRVWFSQAV